MTKSKTDANHDENPLEPRLAILVLIASAVLLFRGAAWLNPSSVIVIPPTLAVPLNGLGVLFLACGVWAWRSSPSSLTRVFLAYGIGGCVHWGGTIAAESSEVEIVFLVFYLSATAMGDAAFLDLSLRYPRAMRRRRLLTMYLYLPAILAFSTIPIAPFLPRQMVEVGLISVLVIAFLMSTAGGLVFVVKWFRATPLKRREYTLTPIVAVLVISTGIALMADAGLFPGEPEAGGLMYGLEPLVLAWALTRKGNAAETNAAT